MVKNLFKLYGNQTSLLYKTIILKIVEAMLYASGFGFIYFTLRDLLAGNLTPQLGLYYVLGYLASLVLAYTVNNIQKYSLSIKEHDVFAKERMKLADYIKKLPMGFFNKESAGDLNNTLTESIRSLEALSTVLGKSVATISLASMFLVTGLTVDWRMTIAMFIGMPLAYYILIKDLQATERELLERQDVQGQVSETTIEFVRGIKEIKAFGKSSTSLKSYQQAVDNFKRINLMLVNKLIRRTTGFQLSVNIGFIPVMILGAYLLMAREDLSVAIYLMFLMATLRIYLPLQELAGDIDIVKHASAGLTKVNRIYDNRSLTESAVDNKIKKCNIEFKNVSFAYEKEQVLKNISFYVPENTITALMGPSGSGKTTITNLLARFWDIEEGEITIGGVNVKDIKTAELLSHISMVFQDVYLFNDSILNNIKMGKQDAADEEVIIAAKKANCHEFIMDFPDKYRTVVGEGGGKLSGGEKQRISIARAFIKNAPIILLDEATANIDPENEFVIQSSITNLVRDKTVIVIAHKLSTIRAADQIVVLKNGEIAQLGTHEELSKTKGGIYNNYKKRRQRAKGWKIAN
ncbi:MAG: ABC transporter ATP-binding protein [Alkaliphilus sp.]